MRHSAEMSKSLGHVFSRSFPRRARRPPRQAFQSLRLAGGRRLFFQGQAHPRTILWTRRPDTRKISKAVQLRRASAPRERRAVTDNACHAAFAGNARHARPATAWNAP